MKWMDIAGLSEEFGFVDFPSKEKALSREEKYELLLKHQEIERRGLEKFLESTREVRIAALAQRRYFMQLNQDEEILDSSESTYSSRAVLLDFDPEDHIDN